MAGGAHEHEINDINGLEQDLADLVAAGAEIKAFSGLLEQKLVVATDQLADLKARVAKLELGTQPNPDPVWTPEFPGDVKPGTIRWGLSHQSNSEPATHETAAGVSVGVRRTFWSMAKTNGLLSAVRADHSKGRVPWVSVKLGTAWQNVANGTIDTALLKLFADLGATGKPVWFTAHHEPENDPADGTAANWRAMQVKVRQLLTQSGVTNIAFVPVLMSWTFDSRSGRKPADWWVDGIWDFAGIDHYVDASAIDVRTGMWNNAADFYAEKGLRIGIGEWGMRGDSSPAGASEVRDWYEYLISIGSPGACYFDTTLNGGYPLSGAVLDEFRQLMAVPTSVRLA